MQAALLLACFNRVPWLAAGMDSTPATRQQTLVSSSTAGHVVMSLPKPLVQQLELRWSCHFCMYEAQSWLVSSIFRTMLQSSIITVFHGKPVTVTARFSDKREKYADVVLACTYHPKAFEKGWSIQGRWPSVIEKTSSTILSLELAMTPSTQTPSSCHA